MEVVLFIDESLACDALSAPHTLRLEVSLVAATAQGITWHVLVRVPV